MGASPGEVWGPMTSLIPRLNLIILESNPGAWSRSCSPGISFPICEMGHQYLPSYSLQPRTVGGSNETTDQIPFIGKCFEALKGLREIILGQPPLLGGPEANELPGTTSSMSLS